MKQSGNKGSSNLTHALLYSTESITGLMFSLVSIALIARHFGPHNLARFSVAQSVSTIFMVFATLGLEQYILREMTRNKDDSEFATSVITGILLGWVAYAALIGIYYYLFKEFTKDIFLIVNIIASTFFLKVVFLKNYLQAQNKPKPIALASLASRVIAIIYLVVGTHFNFSFDAMMIYMPLQALVLTVGMGIAEPAFFRLFEWQHFNSKRLCAVVREASPLLASTFLYFFYSQSDILIMSSLLTPTDVGIYSVAIRLIPQVAFIGHVLVATFYKDMDKKLLTDRTGFDVYVKSLLTIQFGIGIIMAASVCLSSEFIIHLLYGSRYADSSKVLAIACWAWVFILPAALYSRILIMLGYVRYELIKMIIVAPIVVSMNYIAIKTIGIYGSAFVFILSYFLVDFLVYFFFKETRPLGLIGLQALRDLFTKPRQTAYMAMNLLKAKSGV